MCNLWWLVLVVVVDDGVQSAKQFSCLTQLQLCQVSSCDIQFLMDFSILNNVI